MIKVAIADDHPLIRKGIETVLNAEADIKLTSKASDGNELLSNIDHCMPDIAVVDITMPGIDGFDLLKDMNLRFPGLPVLVLSLHPAEHYAVRCIKAGASGYLNKSSITGDLVNAIRYITNKKKTYVSPEVANQLVQSINKHVDGPLYETLSDRELTVLCMIARGKNVKTIADKLFLSPHTVQTYRTRIKEKMQLNSDVEITRYAIEHHLV